MALLIRGKTDCVLCNQVIGHDDAIVATSHFIRDEQDPFWRYSDAIFHQSCFLAWEQRETFVTRFNEIVGKMVFRNGARLRMAMDGRINKLPIQE